MTGAVDELSKLDTENESQYLWRVDKAIRDGHYKNWKEVTDRVNHELYDDESDYKGESAFRKQVAYARKFYEDGVFDAFTDDSYINELKDQKEEIELEKIKLRDERVSRNREIRNQARMETTLNHLENLITNTSQYKLTAKQNLKDGDTDLIVCLSDLHVGIDYNNNFDCYNSDVAQKRMDKYLDSILMIGKRHHAKKVYVCLLGDIVNGRLRYTSAIENRENLIEQVQKAAEMVSAFIYSLALNFDMVYVSSVSGNHSRLGKKEDVIRDERLDNLIPWYANAKLSKVQNVQFLTDQMYDSSIAFIDVRDLHIALVHGDYDTFDKTGIERLTMMTHSFFDAVLFGHMHSCSYSDLDQVKLIRSGSFSGAGDNYCVQSRIISRPTQMVCVVGDDGFESFYPVDLK